MTNTIYDIAIIGAGPAGLNTALYASRAGLKVVFIEKSAPGGKLTATSKIENWIGTEIIDGYDLALKSFNHAKKFGAEYKYGDVVKIENISKLKHNVYLANDEIIVSKTVVIATGMQNREPSFIKNYQKFKFNSISFCATCDGPLYKNKNILVLGGGNSAVEESSFLANIVNKIFLIVRDDHFIAEKILVKDLEKHKNVKILFNTEIEELKGNDKLESAILINNKTKEKEEVFVDAFFPFIGFIPNTKEFSNLNIFDKNGFIEVNKKMETKIPGIYAVGDVIVKDIRQIVTAAADGAIAAKSISELINREDDNV